jgi:hypothetical protein
LRTNIAYTLMPEAHCLLFTSTVYVNAAHTSVVDPVLREAQYIESLTFWIKRPEIKKIIVCDNSMFLYPEWLRTLAEAENTKIEFLRFEGSSKMIMSRGKGFGEGEIIEHIFMHSKLFQSSTSFFKVTGRLKVLNLRSVLARFKNEKTYFLLTNLRPKVCRLSAQSIDTRFYYINKMQFERFLLKGYKEVNEANGVFLEHVYYNKLRGNHPFSPFFPVPRISGVSGSYGLEYKLPLYKWLAYNLVVFFRMY